MAVNTQRTYLREHNHFFLSLSLYIGFTMKLIICIQLILEFEDSATSGSKKIGWCVLPTCLSFRIRMTISLKFQNKQNIIGCILLFLLNNLEIDFCSFLKLLISMIGELVSKRNLMLLTQAQIWLSSSLSFQEFFICCHSQEDGWGVGNCETSDLKVVSFFF